MGMLLGYEHMSNCERVPLNLNDIVCLLRTKTKEKTYTINEGNTVTNCLNFFSCCLTVVFLVCIMSKRNVNRKQPALELNKRKKVKDIVHVSYFAFITAHIFLS